MKGKEREEGLQDRTIHIRNTLWGGERGSRKKWGEAEGEETRRDLSTRTINIRNAEVRRRDRLTKNEE